MQDTTVGLGEAPAAYRAQQKLQLQGWFVAAGALVVVGLIGAGIGSLGGYWWWVGGPTVLVAVLLLTFVVLDLPGVIGDLRSQVVRRIESDGVRLAFIYRDQEIQPFTERGNELINGEKAKSMLVLDDGSRWRLIKPQPDQVRFAKKVRLWVGPRSGAILLIDVLDPAKT